MWSTFRFQRHSTTHNRSDKRWPCFVHGSQLPRVRRSPLLTRSSTPISSSSKTATIRASWPHSDSWSTWDKFSGQEIQDFVTGCRALSLPHCCQASNWILDLLVKRELQLGDHGHRGRFSE